jgi:hypothetical protein
VRVEVLVWQNLCFNTGNNGRSFLSTGPDWSLYCRKLFLRREYLDQKFTSGYTTARKIRIAGKTGA